MFSVSIVPGLKPPTGPALPTLKLLQYFQLMQSSSGSRKVLSMD